MIFKNSARTAKKTQHVTITKIIWLTQFKEIIAVCCENLTKSTDAVGRMQTYLLLKAVLGFQRVNMQHSGPCGV
jgi:hypothetical protein